MVLERLHQALWRLDLAELALDDAEGRSEPVSTAGTDVHLLHDGAVAPPLGAQLRIRPDGEEWGAGGVEAPRGALLELARGGAGVFYGAPSALPPPGASRWSRCSH